MRILIWLVVALAVFTWVKRAIAPTSPDRRHPPAKGGNAETMLQCARCHVYFPASEAVRGAGDTVYCCAEHRS
jgi:uncharacterized protein